MGKVKDAEQVEAEKAREPEPAQQVEQIGFSDEADFEEIKTTWSFYAPMYGDPDPRNPQALITRTDPTYAPDGFITLRGIPLARRRRVTDDDKEQYYYLVVLTAPMLAKRFKEGGEGLEWYVAEAGEMVWADQRAGQDVIRQYLPRWTKDQAGDIDRTARPSSVTEMIIRPLRKEAFKAKNGQTQFAWRFQLKAQRRDPSANWKSLEPLRKEINYLPPATPEFAEVSEDTKQLPF